MRPTLTLCLLLLACAAGASCSKKAGGKFQIDPEKHEMVVIQVTGIT